MTKNISHKQATALGWTRIDAKPWSKLQAQWKHRDGWTIEHCGHPTALYPWALYDSHGEMIRTGARTTARDPKMGTAWRSLRDAMLFVAGVAARCPAQGGVGYEVGFGT